VAHLTPDILRHLKRKPVPAPEPQPELARVVPATILTPEARADVTGETVILEALAIATGKLNDPLDAARRMFGGTQ
jgi:hypothetical protein